MNLYTKNPDGSDKLVLSSRSRSLWFNKLSLAKELIQWSSTAAGLEESLAAVVAKKQSLPQRARAI